jgi:hypothetical protein
MKNRILSDFNSKTLESPGLNYLESEKIEDDKVDNNHIKEVSRALNNFTLTKE